MQEPLLEVVTDPQVMTELSQQEKKAESNKKKLGPQGIGDNSDTHQMNFTFQATIYLITELGTIVGLTFDFAQQLVVKIRISDHIKNLVCFRIKQVAVTQGEVHMQMAMLVEHDCICIVHTEQPKSYQLMNKQVTLLNEHDIAPTIGLVQCGIPNVQ